MTFTGAHANPAGHQQKTPPFTEVKRRGRNREEARNSLWGIKKISQRLTQNLRSGYADKFLGDSSFSPTDDTRFTPHVQLLFE
jgi:hypothetical protein